MKPENIFSLIVLIGLSAGCAGPLAAGGNASAIPTPTALSLFADRGVVTAASASPQRADSTAQPSTASDTPFDSPPAAVYPTLTPYPTATWLPTEKPPPGPVEVPIYADGLSNGWQVVSPERQMSFDLTSKDQVHSGTTAIAVTPNQSHGKIYIVANQYNKSEYPRAHVLGIRLWIYSGERGLDQYDLALTAIGSNVYTYWREDDYSVISKTPYEETFLRWFGYDRNIAPFTWAPIEIWLNEMRFDPDYQYVTGLYITNRQGFTRTFYIDDVSLLLQPSESQNPPTFTPKP